MYVWPAGGRSLLLKMTDKVNLLTHKCCQCTPAGVLLCFKGSQAWTAPNCRSHTPQQPGKTSGSRALNCKTSSHPAYHHLCTACQQKHNTHRTHNLYCVKILSTKQLYPIGVRCGDLVHTRTPSHMTEDIQTVRLSPLPTQPPPVTMQTLCFGRPCLLFKPAML